ncbi:serine/threonine-protein kinase/endoribonuclease IRE1a isoform X1 [Eucalyptus grandis]|uniref:serine/threonine-protein kinase/endoribonuclease IRE1a isoform X1 n=1 Tax=Eucalyptus grandis TaxID=71139 RepID=UPI00192EEBBC|nr:serine/threonine-protein kinase/endoribonuclease IRE1a isoform X1 [Eucalyptus grandis]
MNLEKPVGGDTSGCWIGKLFVSNTEIAEGSQDTIILEGDPSLKMPSQMKINGSIQCDGSHNRKDEHVSLEINSKLGTNRINDKSQSKLKVPRWIKKTNQSGKRNDNLDKKDEHVSSEKEDRLGDSRSGDEGDFNLKTLSKRKKSCKSEESNGGLGEHRVFSENEGRPDNSVGNDDASMNLEKPVGGDTSGCWIGKLFVSNTEIAKGSQDTIILEGFYEGQPVAVKRLALAQHHVASKEIRSLRASDRDPNIVRFYGAENDQDFVYLARERCACSLDDLIRAHSNSSEKYVFPDDLASNAINEYKMRLDSVKGTMQDVNLWREDGHPSPLLLKLMRDVVSGLVHLHRLGIIHQDLKPQSVLITKEFCAKLSDMGSSKLLPEDTSPSGYHVPDCGSLALHTAEQLCPAHQMYSVDLFGLGCILFFCITGGKHPFGDSLKGDNNIKEYSIDLSPVEFLPEAADLFARLLNPNPNLRPKAMVVLHQPLFWNSKMRLSFLRDASDWVELKARGTNPDLMEKLESVAWRIFDEEWNGKIDRKVIRHMRGFRAYKFKRVRDLLRIVRNTFCHAIGLPRNIQVCFYFPVQLLQGNFASMVTWTLPITSLLPIRKSLVYVRCLSIYSTIIKPVRQ